MKILTKLLMPTPKSSTIVRLLDGVDIIVDPVMDKGVEESIYYFGTYEAGTIDVLQKYLRDGDVMLDIGSNIGIMSLCASRFVGYNGRVHSFEPEPDTFTILKRNIALNEIDNIFPHNIALGSKKANASIYTRLEVNRGMASLVKPNNGIGKGKEVSVETLDEFLKSNNVANVRIVKIDVEGWEMEVLKGAENLLKSTAAPIICIEYCTKDQRDRQALDLYEYILAINNYSIYKLEKGKEIPSKLIKIADASELPSLDNLFCFLPVHRNKTR